MFICRKNDIRLNIKLFKYSADCNRGRKKHYEFLYSVNFLAAEVPNWKVDKKAMIRNWIEYNRILYPALNTKRERDTYNEDGTKIKTAQVKSQGDSSVEP